MDAWTEPISTLTSHSVVSVEPTTTLRVVVERLVGSGVGLVVVDDGGSTAGVVSEHDVLDALQRGADIDEIWARDVMSTDLLAAEPDETIGEAARRMIENQVRHLLVFGEHGGVVSIRDVLEAVVA